MISSPVGTRALVLVSTLALMLAFSGSSEIASAAEPVAGLELEIAGVRLLDPESARPILGEVDSGAIIGTVYYHLANSARTETITFIQHPGAERFSIAGVEVDANSPSPSVREFPLAVERFTSARGVILGMSRRAVKERLGAPTSESESELRYSYEAEPWLKQFNFPTYESFYRFKEGRLVRFAFGFPYP